jgi:hypothetical protein
MATNKERMNYLRERIKSLNREIEEKALENQYQQMVDEIAAGTLRIVPLDEEDLEVMTAKERERNLLSHYHTLRTEVDGLKQELNNQGALDKMTKWLEHSWVKRGVTIVALAKVATAVSHMIAQSGIFYIDEKNTRRSDK